MSLPVVFTETADAHVEEIDLWWRENRPGAPRLFTQELAEVLNLVSALPGAGRVYQAQKGVTVRRAVMRATRHQVYYVVEPDHVLVLAVWGAGPELP